MLIHDILLYINLTLKSIISKHPQIILSQGKIGINNLKIVLREIQRLLKKCASDIVRLSLCYVYIFKYSYLNLKWICPQ